MVDLPVHSAAAALVAAPLVVFAHETDSHDETTSVPKRRAVVVNKSFDRVVADGCHYEGTVQGVVGEFPSGRVPGETRYNGSLALQGQLSCPDGTWQPIGPLVIHRHGCRRGDLARAIESSGRTAVEHAGRVCTVTPTVAWHRGALVIDDTFSQSCSSAVGGGPATDGASE
jgi:hypothetical protein